MPSRRRTSSLAQKSIIATRLIGDITGPLTLAELGQPPSFVADWARARLSVRGRPPDPEGVSVLLDEPRLDRVGGGGGRWR